MSVYFAYLIVPFFAWLVAGSLKFLINCVRERRWATDLIGYGGMPSNHSAIVGSVVGLIGLREGISHPAFGVSVALAFIVVLDASSLRKHIEKQAKLLNHLATRAGQPNPLRERLGHTPMEIFAGLVVGLLTALVLYCFF